MQPDAVDREQDVASPRLGLQGTIREAWGAGVSNTIDEAMLQQAVEAMPPSEPQPTMSETVQFDGSRWIPVQADRLGGIMPYYYGVPVDPEGVARRIPRCQQRKQEKEAIRRQQEALQARVEGMRPMEIRLDESDDLVDTALPF